MTLQDIHKEFDEIEQAEELWLDDRERKIVKRFYDKKIVEIIEGFLVVIRGSRTMTETHGIGVVEETARLSVISAVLTAYNNLKARNINLD